MVLGKLGNGIFVKCGDARSVNPVKILARRLHRGGECVHERGIVGRDNHVVRSRLARNARDAFVLKREAIKLRIAHVVLVRKKINIAARFVNRRMAGCAGTDAAVAGDAPVAAGQLIELLSGKVVKIIVAEAAALARPQKSFVVREKIKIEAQVDPVFVCFSENRLRCAGGGITEKQIEPVLRAVQALDGDAAAIAQPVHARKIHVRIRAGVHPFRFRSCRAARNGYDADSHDGICFACLRETRVFHGADRRTHVHDRIARHGPLIHFVVGDFRGIGRPPVGRGSVKLLGIDPIELALENFLAAAGGERVNFSGRDIHNRKI